MLQTLSLTSCGDRSKLYEELSASKDLWLCTSFVFLYSKVVNPFDTVRSFFSFKDQTVSYQTMYLVFITLLLCSSHNHLRRLLELAVIKLHNHTDLTRFKTVTGIPNREQIHAPNCYIYCYYTAKGPYCSFANNYFKKS